MGSTEGSESHSSFQCFFLFYGFPFVPKSSVLEVSERKRGSSRSPESHFPFRVREFHLKPNGWWVEKIGVTKRGLQERIYVSVVKERFFALLTSSEEI